MRTVFHCWFQLADLNTDAVDPSEYVAWVQQTTGTLFRGEGGFAHDVELCEHIRQKVKPLRADFDRHWSDWCTAFNLQARRAMSTRCLAAAAAGAAGTIPRCGPTRAHPALP